MNFSAPLLCPDCNRVCERGTLNKECTKCTCEDHKIRIVVTDTTGNPLENAQIYKLGHYDMLGRSNRHGEFRWEIQHLGNQYRHARVPTLLQTHSSILFNWYLGSSQSVLMETISSWLHARATIPSTCGQKYWKILRRHTGASRLKCLRLLPFQDFQNQK